MGEKSYLIHIDILGFEQLPDEIAKKKAIDSSIVRSHFIEVITEKIETLEKERLITHKLRSKDDWLLTVGRPESVFTCIQQILNHYTGYQDFISIPLEIGIGIAEYDKRFTINEDNIIDYDETIKFLKSSVLYDFHEWFKREHGEPIKTTFISITEPAYIELLPYSKSIWKTQKFNNKTLYYSDENGIKKRASVYEFLAKIGHSGSRFYDNIDTLYVAPREFTAIKKVLSEERIVFITGTQEYGKTYTAVRLMWEYFNRGYEPRWYKGREKEERIQVREKLEQIKSELKPDHIVYFEDPFGKVRYEKRESLEREIGTILDCVTQVEDAYVIITSREEVFKEFSKEKVTQRMLANFERKLNIQRPSYDSNKRKKMAIMWAKNETCLWLSNRNLKRLVVDALSDDSVLPTPLSIRDFAFSTLNVIDKQTLETKMQEKSIETEKAFAKEIKEMSDDKFIFLFLPLISAFENSFIRQIYREMIREFKIDNAWDYETVYKWFLNDKISTFNKYVGFSHPSYSQAIEIILTEEESLTERKKQIVKRLLHRLTEEQESAIDVAYFIDVHFNEIPNSIRNELLVNISAWEDTVDVLALIMGEHFNEIPSNIRNSLLNKIIKYGDQIAGAIGEIISSYFSAIPSGLRNQLLIKALEWEESAEIISQSIKTNLERIPKIIRDIMLIKLARWSVSAEVATWIIEQKFEDISSGIRDSVLLKLLKWNHVSEPIVRIIQTHFDEIPRSSRNNMLYILSDIEEAAVFVATLLKNCFNRMSPITREKILAKLVDFDESSEIIADVVHAHFLSIHETQRNQLLLTLATKYYAVFRVISIVDFYFDKIPAVVRKPLLIRLAEWDVASDSIRRLIKKNESKISGETRGELLLTISDMDNPTPWEFETQDIEDNDDSDYVEYTANDIFFKVEVLEDLVTSIKNSIYNSKNTFVLELNEIISNNLDELEKTIDGMLKFVEFAEYDNEPVPLTTVQEINIEVHKVESVLEKINQLLDQINLNATIIEKEKESLLKKLNEIITFSESIIQYVQFGLTDNSEYDNLPSESYDLDDDLNGSEP